MRAQSLGVLAGLLLLTSVGPPSLARNPQFRYGDVEATVLDATPESSRYGYSEARYRLRNHSAATAHRVELLLPDVAVAQTALAQVSREVELAPGATVEVSLLQPPLSSYGNGTGVVIDGTRQKELLSTFPAYGLGARMVLASRSIAAGDLDAALKLGPGQEFDLVTSPLAPDNWSEDWLAYAGFSGVVLSEHELGALRSGARAALGQYLSAGGVVLVLGAGEGSSFRQTLPVAPRACPGVPGMTCSTVGFGELLETSTDSGVVLSAAESTRVQQAWEHTFGAWSKQAYGSQMAERRFPVLGEALSVPVRGLFLVLLLFAIVVGPLNLSWLRKRKRRMWVLWTVPVISAVTSLVVLTYAMLAEGVTRYERAEGITLLDQDRHVALSLGRLAFYAPLVPGDGLHFSTSTLLLPEEESTSLGRTLDWSQDQHLERGWILARLPAHFVVRKVERRRERLELRVTGSVLEVVNGLGAEIRELWLMDEAGALHVAVGSIPAGAPAQLVQARPPDPTHRARSTPRDLFNDDWTHIDDWARSDAESVLVPGSYVALLQGWPFLESGLVDARETRTSTVYGRFQQGGVP